MKDLSLKRLGLLSVFFFLLVVAFTLGYLLYVSERGHFEGFQDAMSIPGRIMPDLEYVVPIDRGTPLSAPVRNQLRGEVKSIDTNILMVEVNEKQWPIELNSQVYLRCLPKAMITPGGEEILTKDIL